MYFLDTNHVSRLIDRHPAILRRLEALGDAQVATCAIVRGELVFMVERSARRVENAGKVEGLLRAVEVFPADEAAAHVYGRLKAGLLVKYGPKDRKRRRSTPLARLGMSWSRWRR